VVVVSNNQQKPFFWKAGDEKDGKGFFWSTKQAVQQTWEQANASEDSHGYRTFRSIIHFGMISVICAELMLTRAQFDALPEAELLDLIDQKLAPSGPADYLIKLRQIPFSTDATKSLLHRYRAFAEPFIQLTTEAKEAGCPMNEKSIEIAFRAQIRDNELLLMWLQEERWTSIQSAHQRIAKHLKSFDALKLLDSLNTKLKYVPPPPNYAVPLPQAQQPLHLPQQHQAPPTQQPHQGYQGKNFQPSRQSAMVNVMNQLLSRIESMPSHRAEPQSFVNFAQPSTAPVTQPPPPAHAQQNTPARAPGPHPGLDGRGPNWHVCSPLLECRTNPCSTVLFCQGCGRHGHSSDTCTRQHTPLWNHSGYFSDRYPSTGAIYAPPNGGTAPRYQQRFPSPAFQQGASSYQPFNQQPRQPFQAKVNFTDTSNGIPPPPVFPQHSQPSSFPTPHTMTPINHASGAATAPRQYTPVARSNTTQTTDVATPTSQ
jgi:hypothetical protein